MKPESLYVYEVATLIVGVKHRKMDKNLINS